ncbi:MULTISPECIES: hypothetical protein [Nonomuraea]|uniref:Uncharacterized protein n=1 Tax=Nonomuraea zeae TaxID=1642303 RepID=A0A5S4GFJ7_9ACTN|nr:hypothetical protein [Nonomuraea zeae]TMR31746.1 hypothetical protein ETD85_24980 [Nonomuraea zeae]
MSYRSCDDALPGFALRYFPMGALSVHIPAAGEKTEDALTKMPDDYYYRYRAPEKGGQGRYEMTEVDYDPRVEICVRKATRIRVPDSRCTDKDPGHAWYYLRLSSHVPAVGRRAAGGSFMVPNGDSYRARRNGGDGVDAAISYKGPRG